MADLVRTAKSGSSWTKNELDAYRITLNELDPLMFFDVPVGDICCSSSKDYDGFSHRIAGVATTIS